MLVLTLVACSMSGLVHASTWGWNNVGDSYWTVNPASTWTPGSLPSNTPSVADRINLNRPYVMTVDEPVSVGEASDFIVHTSDGELNITEGGALTVGYYRQQGAGSQPTLRLSGGTLHLIGGGNSTRFGNQVGGTMTSNIEILKGELVADNTLLMTYGSPTIFTQVGGVFNPSAQDLSLKNGAFDAYISGGSFIADEVLFNNEPESLILTIGGSYADLIRFRKISGANAVDTIDLNFNIDWSWDRQNGEMAVSEVLDCSGAGVVNVNVNFDTYRPGHGETIVLGSGKAFGQNDTPLINTSNMVFHCVTPGYAINNTSTGSKLQVQVTQVPAQSALFPMDAVPHEEADAAVIERERFLQQRWQDHMDEVSSELADGTFEAYVDGLAAQATQSGAVEDLYLHFSRMGTMYNMPGINTVITPRMLARGQAGCQALVDAINTSPQGQRIWDLDTVQPAIYLLEMACELKRLGAYTGDFKEDVEAIIETYIEGQSYYDGAYYTTGYNKEVFAMRVASLVSILYADDASAYPLTKSTFETFWDNVINMSYDADNSPHYDAGTGLREILRMGYEMDRVSDLQNSIHIQRIIDRMARTVCSSGQSAKWGKSMERMVGQGTTNELQLDAGVWLTWDLMVGYQLYQNPFYLYVARKYADIYLRDATERLTNEVLPHLWIWPEHIQAFEVTAVPGQADVPSRITDRITSSTYYDGLLLGRGDTNYVHVQDKLILSTGHHPRSPYMLMDLSYTGHKAAHDHRIGVDVLMYQGAHLATRYGRRSSANLTNGIFAGPAQIDYPIVPTASSDVTAPSNGSDAYSQYVGYVAAFDYHIRSWEAVQISDDVAYGVVDYEQFAYPGVEAQRQAVLLNNGVLVLLDRIKAVSGYSGGVKVGTLFQIFGPPAQQGDDWVLQSAHRATLPGGSSVPRPDIPTLFYFPSVGSASVKYVNNPYDEYASVNDVFCAWKTLGVGETVEVVSLVMPIRDTSLVAALLDDIEVTGSAGRYTVRLPGQNSATLRVDFYPSQEATFIYE
ncbi:hypothetical protein H5P28_16815 [Ruficoccus amylovorans]|uniref:Uncharacterized protein n=1 Tax=Ruficoccus amylovorans TaxID=1804625 RepID=A0A842HHX0_9BACT|nr:hypothetical protein [Ruficoccus amylovorans]MBC2595929.1 hypothetical protein [Ruficoccus amylovorans]